MFDKIHIGRKKDFPWAKVIYGVAAALAVAGVTTYVVQRVRSGNNLLPWTAQSDDHDYSQYSGFGTSTESQGLRETTSPTYPL